MVNNRLEAKQALISNERSDQQLDEKLLMGKALQSKIFDELAVYDQTKEIECRIKRQLNFPKGIWGNLARLAGVGISTANNKSALTRSVNEALAEDWKSIGNDMKIVFRRNSRKSLKDI